MPFDGAGGAAAAATPAAQRVSRYTPPLSTFFVAALPHALVEGPGGTVYDAAARLYAPPGTYPASWAARWPDGPSAALATQPPARHALLATAIQPYGWMYYHFVVETLPKLVLLRDALPAAAAQLLPGGVAADGDAWNASGARVLLWGMPWEADWLRLVGVPPHAALAYDPRLRYAAATLLLPSPVPAVTPPAEALHAARAAVCAATGCAPRRDALVYASRAGERSRAVANEAALLDALRVAFPTLQLLVHHRGASAAEAVAMFARAAAVVGAHGAGLSHILFCQPGTVVVELMFMHSPPMMFWHIAAAMQLRYALAPLPRSFWGQAAKLADAEEVVALLRRLLPAEHAAQQRELLQAACAPGFIGAANGSCAPCAPGSYAPDSWPRAACVPCLPGRVAPVAGSAFCATCADGTRSVAGVRCEPCPPGTIGVPLHDGAASETCAAVPGHQDALMRLLNESHDGAGGDSAAWAPLPTHHAAASMEDAVEALLYSAQDVALPRRRAAELLPRVYSFTGPQSRPPPPAPLPPLLPQTAPGAAAAPAAARSVFGWPASAKATAAAAVCVCALLLAGACAGFAAGARKARAGGEEAEHEERRDNNNTQQQQCSSAPPPLWTLYTNPVREHLSMSGSDADDER